MVLCRRGRSDCYLKRFQYYSNRPNTVRRNHLLHCVRPDDVPSWCHAMGHWQIVRAFYIILASLTSSSAHGSSSSLWVCLVRKPLSLLLHPGSVKENLLVLFVLTSIVRILINQL